jgi:hypothetical protein
VNGKKPEPLLLSAMLFGVLGMGKQKKKKKIKISLATCPGYRDAWRIRSTHATFIDKRLRAASIEVRDKARP